MTKNYPWIELSAHSCRNEVFTFQFVNACLVFGKGNNLAKTAPWRSCLTTINGNIRNMQGGIFWIRTIKYIAPCRWHLFCIAIDIKEFEAIKESPIPYALNTITDSNRGQTRAIIENPHPYVRHTIGDSNRGQTRAASEFANRFISKIYFLNGKKW